MPRGFLLPEVIGSRAAIGRFRHSNLETPGLVIGRFRRFNRNRIYLHVVVFSAKISKAGAPRPYGVSENPFQVPFAGGLWSSKIMRHNRAKSRTFCASLVTSHNKHYVNLQRHSERFSGFSGYGMACNDMAQASNSLQLARAIGSPWYGGTDARGHRCLSQKAACLKNAFRDI